MDKATAASQGVAVYSAGQVRQLDRLCINEFGIDGYSLMVQAGEALFSALLSHWPDAQQLLILCGKGNNGGDGFVVARLAKQHGMTVQLVLVGGGPEDLKGEAKQAAEDAQEVGLTLTPVESIVWPTATDETVIVDALLGTGIESDVAEPFKAVIDQVNDNPSHVLAVDVPSGLDASRGVIKGACVKADVTVTMIAHKQGLFTHDGPTVTGQVSLAPLNVPKGAREVQLATGFLVNWQMLSQLPYFAPRAMNSHKGMYGHVLIIGGDHGCGGAVSLAAGAALRSGAGLVSVATRLEHINGILARCPEAMVHGVNSGQDLQPLLARADVIVIGPGLGQNHWGEQLLQQVMTLDTPVVMDADALNILAKGRIKDNLLKRESVLTPHPAEASRLLNGKLEAFDPTIDAKYVQGNRFDVVKTLAEKYASSVVLKGLGSIVHTQRQMGICNNGNAGMATAGMGDVLSGIVGSLLAQNCQQLPLGLHDLVCAGVCLHSAAADKMAENGQAGLLASDLEQGIWQLLN